MVTFPDGIRVELTEDKHLQTPVESHHIHFQVDDPEGLRAWYSRMFGGTAYLRRGIIIALKFGMNELDFNKAAVPQAATKARSLDRVGIEVSDLNGLCRRVEHEGVKCETPFGSANRLATAFITDPAGVRIELSERVKPK
jgi:hypothetical protein